MRLRRLVAPIATQRTNRCAASDGETKAVTALIVRWSSSRKQRWVISGERLRFRTLYGHTDDVTSCVFSSDGRLAATGSVDGTVRIWSVPEGQPVSVLRGHVGAV
jgi:WD40 repeat protein